MTNNINEIVNELNCAIVESGYSNDGEIGFVYMSDGFCECIKFLGCVLWNSDNEEREWIEDANDYAML